MNNRCLLVADTYCVCVLCMYLCPVLTVFSTMRRAMYRGGHPDALASQFTECIPALSISQLFCVQILGGVTRYDFCSAGLLWVCGPCRANLHNGGLTQSPSCDCGQRQTMNHIVDTCPFNKIWRWTESTSQSGWWCSHMAGIYSNCSTREIIIASFVNVTILNLICKGAAASQPLVTDTVVNSLCLVRWL